MIRRLTIAEFAVQCFDSVKSDRYHLIGVAGQTGVGKSTFSTKLAKEYCKLAGLQFNFNCMTWDRNEMMRWIDGDKSKEPDPLTGLRPGQMPEYSVIIPDELFAMYYRRNWNDENQKDSIATFNMCRDRHLLVVGNIPNFWELDSGFRNRVSFYVFLPKRGVAWIFKQEDNPFGGSDSWNEKENKMAFRRKKTPYSMQNFFSEIFFDDWEAEEKRQYLLVRNEKRINPQAETDKILINGNPKREWRIKMIKYLSGQKKTNREISELTGISEALISPILNQISRPVEELV